MAVAGARFESYVKDAMRESEIPSLAELSRRSGIAVSAWHGWFRGERQPRRNSLVLAGTALARTPEQLLAVWDGERPHKPARATETGDAVALAIDRQTAALERLFGEWLSRWDGSPQPDASLEAEAETAIDGTRETLRDRRPRPLRKGP